MIRVFTKDREGFGLIETIFREIPGIRGATEFKYEGTGSCSDKLIGIVRQRVRELER